jgi:hypothetical protein
MEGDDAIFSECRCYRYRWWRIRDPSNIVTFIALNPATADEKNGDQTADKCCRYAEAWGHSGVVICNLFAWCDKDWGVTKLRPDPVGLENDIHIQESLKASKLAVVAWGNSGVFMDRAAHVLPMVKDAHCLHINKTRQPTHPLYLAGNLRPVPYQYRNEP